jgi:hypothetical protein
MGAAFGFCYLTGFVVTWIALYRRAGFQEIDADWREFLISNLPWFALMIVKFWFWPVTLIGWLIDGRPSSRWRAVTELNGRPVRKIVRVPASPRPSGSYNKI